MLIEYELFIRERRKNLAKGAYQTTRERTHYKDVHSAKSLLPAFEPLTIDHNGATFASTVWN